MSDALEFVSRRERSATITSSHIAFMFSVACCLYATKLFLSPVYPVFFALLALALLQKASRSCAMSLPYDCVPLLLFLVYSTALLVRNVDGAMPTYVNLLLGSGAYILIRSYRNSSPAFWASCMKAGALVFGVLAAFDTAYRLSHPQHPDLEYVDIIELEEHSSPFYLYKYGSLMFADSNTTALIALMYLFCLVALRRHPWRVSVFWIAGYGALVLLTLSRAAILSTVFMTLLLLGRKRHWIYVAAPVVAVIALLGLGTVQDGSFLSKIDIVKRLTSYYMQTPTLLQDLIFGVGIGQSTDKLGIYSHILLVTLLFEFGATGAFVYLAFLLMVVMRYRLARWPLGAMLLTSFSYFLYVGGPFFFVPLAILVNFERSATRSSTEQIRLSRATPTRELPTLRTRV